MAFLKVTYFGELKALDRGDTRGDPLEQLLGDEERGEYEWKNCDTLSRQHGAECSCQMIPKGQLPRHLDTKFQVTQVRGGQVTKIEVRVRHHVITAA